MHYHKYIYCPIQLPVERVIVSVSAIIGLCSLVPSKGHATLTAHSTMAELRVRVYSQIDDQTERPRVTRIIYELKI